MKIFLTGGAGYIGSICAEYLLDRGHEVAVFDNLTEGHRSAVDPRARFVGGDLNDREGTLAAVRGAAPEAVMHFAANALVAESMRDPSKYFRNNVGGGINLADAAVAAAVKVFIFSSTCATYGVPGRMPMDETLPQRPINPYGESKLMFERVLDWYDRIHGLRHVNLRYFNAAGASEKFGEHHRIETHLIPNVLRVALGQSPHAEVYGTDLPTPDGTCVRDFIHITDLAQAHELALGAPASASYNIGTGSGYSVKQVIDVARKITGHPIPVVEKPARPGDPPRLVASADKLRRELGWRPKFESIEGIVDSAWRWHKARPRGYGD
jgi:UDP-glucose 4-epimerase